MARVGIISPRVFGASMTTMRPLVRRLGRDPALAEALWDTGWLEARLVAGVVAEPARLTAAPIPCVLLDVGRMCAMTRVWDQGHKSQHVPEVRRRGIDGLSRSRPRSDGGGAEGLMTGGTTEPSLGDEVGRIGIIFALVDGGEGVRIR
jgi:hypothetical protein